MGNSVELDDASQVQRGEDAEKSTQLEPPRRLSAEHLALIFTIAPILLVFLRVVRIAGLDASTLALLIQTIDIFSLALSTLIQYGPPLLLLALGLAILAEIRSPKRDTSNLPPISSLPKYLIIIAFIAAIYVTSPVWLLAIALFVAMNIGFDRFWMWSDRRRGKSPIFADYTAMFLAIFLMLLLMPAALWLPSEKIETRSNGALVGYVLDEKSDRVVIMIEETRDIITIQSNDVSKREPCRLSKGSPLKPLIGYISGPTAELPTCLASPPSP